MSKRTNYISVVMADDEVAAMDEWMRHQRIRSRSEAIRQLVTGGIASMSAHGRSTTAEPSTQPIPASGPDTNSSDLTSIQDALSEVLRLVESAPGIDPTALNRLTAVVEAVKTRIVSAESVIMKAISLSTATMLSRFNEVVLNRPEPETRAGLEPVAEAREPYLTEEEAERRIQGFSSPQRPRKHSAESDPVPTIDALQAQVERLRAVRAQQLAETAPQRPTED